MRSSRVEQAVVTLVQGMAKVVLAMQAGLKVSWYSMLVTMNCGFVCVCVCVFVCVFRLELE